MDQKLLEQIVVQHYTVRERAETLRFDPRPRPCHRCNQLVEDQRLTIVRRNYEYRRPYWEIKCNRCDLKITVKDLTKLQKE